jgi:RNA polymerase sigma factor (sigma-70 family)
VKTAPQGGRDAPAVGTASDPASDGASDASDPLWQRAEALFVAWRGGDAGALEGLVRTLSPVLWHIVRAYGLDRDAADDVVQTTWLTMVRQGDAIRDERAVLRWLTVSARREAWRVSQRSRRTTASDDEALEAALPSQVSAETTALLDDEQRLLWRQVGALSERCQRLLRVIAFSDRPDYAGLASELQMPVGSIGPTRARCLDKLRSLLTTATANAPHDTAAPGTRGTP